MQSIVESVSPNNKDVKLCFVVNFLKSLICVDKTAPK